MRSKALLFFTFFLICSWVQAHPQHASYAEINLSADNKRIQVALRVIPEDLETVLGFQEGRNMVLVDKPEVDKAILTYLWKQFVFTDESGDKLALNWLGKEVHHQGAWLYFTADIGDSKTVYLSNKMIMDYQATYINHVKVINKGQTPVVYNSMSKKQKVFELM